MKRILRQINNIQSALRFFDGDGNPSDVSNLRGNVSNLTGDVSYLTGDVSYLTGNVSNLRGYVDDAEITEKERKNGINVSDLIED